MQSWDEVGQDLSTLSSARMNSAILHPEQEFQTPHGNIPVENPADWDLELSFIFLKASKTASEPSFPSSGSWSQLP